MRRVGYLGLLAVSWLVVGSIVPAADGQETPIPVLATATFPGTVPGDVCFDNLTNLVYVVDAANNDTHVFNANLVYLGVAPSTFPPTTVVTGVTAEPTIGGVIWTTFDTVTLTESLFAAVNIAGSAFFVATIPGPAAATLGVDAPLGLTNALLLNDIGALATRAIDYAGAPIIAPVPNPGGLSFGVAHFAGPFVVNTTFLATGGLSALITNALTGVPVDLVGVLVSPTGTLNPGFDFGPVVGGTNTIYTVDGATGVISQSVFQRSFFRGDANSDGLVNVADPLFLLANLFGTGAPPTCVDAADANDDGFVNIGDPMAILTVLFMGGGPLPAPFGSCGFDPTPDANRCAVSAAACP